MSDYLCNLIIPGAAKSGTSSLFAALADHPKIAVADPKEPQFFSSDERFAGGAEAHNAYFDTSGSAFSFYCDASQSYFADSKALDRITAVLARPKVILMLRHPIERLFSQYRWAVRSGMENESLEKAIAERGERTDYFYMLGSNAYWPYGGYLGFSRYSRLVPMWQAAIPAEDLLIIKAERFFADPEAGFAELFGFLGVPRPQLTKVGHNNSSAETRLRHPPSVFSKLANILPKGLRQNAGYLRLKNSVLHKLSPEPPKSLDLEIRKSLEHVLKADIELHAAL